MERRPHATVELLQILTTAQKSTAPWEETEKLLQSMPELSFDVVKSWSRSALKPKAGRLLRLTSSGIQNIRKNGTKTTEYSYSAVKSVELKDTKTFVLEYEGTKNNYTYTSPVGMMIVQEIRSRIAIFTLAIKQKNQYNIKNKFTQRKPRNESLKSRNTVNFATHRTSCTISDLQISRSNFQRALAKIPLAPKPESEPQDQTPLKNRSETNDTTSKAPLSPKPSQGEEEDRIKTKLTKLLGYSPEQILEDYLNKLLLETSGEECRTIKHVVDHIDVLEKNPHTFTMNVRCFIDGLKDHLIKKYGDNFKKMNIRGDDTIPQIVETSLENIIMKRIYPVINRILIERSLPEEEKLKIGLVILKTRCQADSDIPEKFISPSNWSLAVEEFNEITKYVEPHEKLRCLLRTAQQIYQSVKLEHNSNGKETELGADDFLPILIYVVVQSDVQNMEAMSHYLWELSDPSDLSGEKGYYLTTFSSCLEYIKSKRVTSDE